MEDGRRVSDLHIRPEGLDLGEKLEQLLRDISANGGDPIDAMVDREHELFWEPREFSVSRAQRRTWVRLLLRQHRLPSQAQMNTDEATALRTFLLGHFAQVSDRRDLMRRLLRQAEDSFGNGRLAQAEVMLGVFRGDRSVERNNARNLYFDRIARQMARQEQPRSIRLPAGDGGIEHLLRICAAMNASLGVRFVVPGASSSTDPLADLDEHLPGIVRSVTAPLRPIGDVRSLASITEGIRTGVDSVRLADTVAHTLRLMYFACVTTGHRGLENGLPAAWRWLRRQSGERTPRALADLHRITRLEDGMIEPTAVMIGTDCVADIGDRPPPSLASCTGRFADIVESTDIEHLNPGEYDLCGLLAHLGAGAPFTDSADVIASFRVL